LLEERGGQKEDNKGGLMKKRSEKGKKIKAVRKRKNESPSERQND